MEGTMETTKTAAYQSGASDGATRVDDEIVARGAPPSAVEIQSWFARGNGKADEALINALGYGRALADVLGISTDEAYARGPAFDHACEEYNRGFRDGAIESASR